MRIIAAEDLPAVPDNGEEEEGLLALDDEDNEELVYLAGKDDIIECRLSPEQKRMFDKAKDEALQPWIDNGAWEPAATSEAQTGESCPLRFLLKWKKKDGQLVANARVIMQGFKLGEVTTKKLDTESPTLSRLGRNIILIIASAMRWKIFAADVKSAFLQADDIVETEGLRIFGLPPMDMRRRLERMMNLKPDQILRMRRPAFGDVRAPRQWHDSAQKSMKALDFQTHVLEQCLFLSPQSIRRRNQHLPVPRRDVQVGWYRRSPC